VSQRLGTHWMMQYFALTSFVCRPISSCSVKQFFRYDDGWS